MKLLDLHIGGFGKFHDRDITFSDGLNIIYGKNEAGKSTLHTFIRAMLFGLERGRGRAARGDVYSHYEPWENKAVYGGRMRVEQDGIIYRIERSFQKDQKKLVIVDETNGREVEPTKAFMDQLLCGLSETTYANTISIGQLKSATDGGMIAELRNYIANMNTSGNMSLNITKATANLQSRRKEFERQLHPDAAKNYAAMTAEIRSIEKEIASPEYVNRLREIQNQRQGLKKQLLQKQEERETLLQKIASGRQVLSGAQFTDEASILKYQEDTERAWEEYQEDKELSEKKSRTVWMMLFYLLGVAGTAAAVFFGFAGDSVPIRLAAGVPARFFCYGAAAFALVFFAFGLMVHQKTRALKKNAAANGKILQEIFSRHLGDGSVSEDALQAFHARMEDFLRLSSALVRSEQSVEAQAAEIAELQKQENLCDEDLARQQRFQWELEKKLDQLTSCKDRVETLEQELAENERIREELEAIDLAMDTITELSSTIRSSFGHYLNKNASDMIRGITGGVYTSMSVDESLNVFMNTPTKLVPVSQVSSGTMDQIYLALRLAAAKLIQSGHDQMPLVFDDSFVLYDDERLRIALRWLAEAYDNQILIFTCHQREAQMLVDSGIDYQMVEI